MVYKINYIIFATKTGVETRDRSFFDNYGL